MATTATLTPASSTTTDTNSKLNRKSSLDFDDLNSSNSTYRIPKRTNTSEMNESSTTKTLNRQTSDESNSQQGKRKFSLSQYKEHKRLKSNEIQHPSLADTDMRMNQNRPNYNNQSSSPPPPSTYADDESVVSPKSEEISKDPVMKSNLSEPGVKKVNKKKVIWADEKNQSLVQTSFFEVDDSELSDMHIFARQCAANISIAQLEKVMERDLRKKRGIQDNNLNDNDDKQYSTPLPRLIKIILPDGIQIPQIISQERFVQEEREKTVLQALFIRSFLPDSPGEPDGEPIGNNLSTTEPKLIPLEDDASSTVSNKISSVVSNNSLPLGTINNSVSSSTPTITTTTTTPSLSTFSLTNISPEVAQILAQAKGNASTVQATTPSNTTTTTTTPIITNTNLPTPPPPNFLSALLNATTRTTNNETLALPPPPPPNPLAILPNLPLGFNLQPPTPFPLSLIANALSLGIPPPPPTAANPSLFPPNPTAFTVPPTLPNLSNPLGNNSLPSTSTLTGNNSKPPSVRFVAAMGIQPRPNLSNNDHSMSSSRENSRDHHFRRGPPHHNRRDYYHNRNNNNNNSNNHNHNNNNNNNNNNNRNIFS